MKTTLKTDKKEELIAEATAILQWLEEIRDVDDRGSD